MSGAPASHPFGTAVADAAAFNLQHNPNLDPAGNVVTDIPCRKCGYDLRGLSVNGRCPECGAAVGVSVHGNLLRFSDPGWVRGLQKGAWLILVGVLILIVGAIFAALLGAASPQLASVVAPLLSIGGNIVMIVGAWRLTEPDPSGIGEDEYGTSRKIIRVALVVGIFNSILNNIPRAGSIAPEMRMVLGTLSVIAGLIGLVGQFAQLNYLSKLAMRIPDQQASERARFLMFAIGISYGIILLGGLAMLFTGLAAGPRSPGGGFIGGACVMALAAIALLVFGVMYLFLLSRLSRAFGEQAQAAEQTWARNAAPAAAMG
jgi:hypothetical protein